MTLANTTLEQVFKMLDAQKGEIMNITIADEQTGAIQSVIVCAVGRSAVKIHEAVKKIEDEVGGVCVDVAKEPVQ